MANLTKAQRAAKAAAVADAAAAAAAASAPTISADQTKKGDSGTADGIAAPANGADLETLNTETASEVAQVAADADAANAVLVGESNPAAGADDGIDTVADTAVQDAPTAGPVTGYPLRARVTNNTRMPVQVPALNLDLPASGEATITIYSEGDFKTLHSDLTALFSLNGLGEDAFAVGPAETTEA